MKGTSKLGLSREDVEPALEVEGTKSELRTVPRTFPMAMFGKGSVGSGEVRPQKSLTWPDLVWRQFIPSAVPLVYCCCTAVPSLFSEHLQGSSVQDRRKNTNQPSHANASASAIAIAIVQAQL